MRLETLVITEHTHSENNDWQESVAERSSASETSAHPLLGEVPSQSGEHAGESPALAHLAAPGAQGLPPDPSEGQMQPAAQYSLHPLAASEERETWLHLSASVESSEPSAPLSEAQMRAPFDGPASLPVVAGQEAVSGRPDEATRPFTHFIEEFRQREERFGTRLSGGEPPFLAFSPAPGGETMQAADTFREIPGENRAHTDEKMSAPGEGEQEKQLVAEKSEAVPAGEVASEQPPLVPPPPPERPVSPLLRPPRARMPRHSRHRVEPAVPVSEAVEPEPEKAAELPFEEKPVPAEMQAQEQPTRPARRYRFDRPAATASASLSTARLSALPTPSRIDEAREKKNASLPVQKDNGLTASEPAIARPGISGAVSDAPVQKTAVQETTSPTAEVAPSVSERRRKGNHERQREKEQAALSPLVAQVQEPAPLMAELMPASTAEIPVEDLPPLEYSELQAASSRRRRRRRAGTASITAATNGTLTSRTAVPEPPAPPQPAPAAPPVLPSTAPVHPQPSYNIVSGYTINQMNQGNDSSGPFMGPEPSPARGSTFTTPPTLRQMRNEALRASSAQVSKHTENPLMSVASVNYLANTVAQAIQAQTDRMVAEWRRVSQAPTNVSVSLPPFPSTERVGVFVDVANLLYSARTLRMTIDFGKLLDFLRGNRRLVRAQAYCPTSPQPGDDQMFLQAVKGLGYRITTKNYKTFSSGAKKADLDLDLCMDVVRLVDGNAVDCIVLVSGDSDFMPMLDYCSDHGVRVEVAAFDESMSATLRQSCDLFVNLSMLEEIRA